MKCARCNVDNEMPIILKKDFWKYYLMRKCGHWFAEVINVGADDSENINDG